MLSGREFSHRSCDHVAVFAARASGSWSFIACGLIVTRISEAIRANCNGGISFGFYLMGIAATDRERDVKREDDCEDLYVEWHLGS